MVPSTRSQTVQRGAASIIIVVLLATVVMTVLLFALRQSNSELLDSYRQTDSTAALFLAESGLEDAAYRFQTLVCGDPGITKAATALAAGTYEIKSAVPSASGIECTVQVIGRVNQSVRTIEATLTPVSAAVTAWAVGNNGVLMQRSTTGVWSLVTPSLVTDAIQGVTCSSTTDCWAVGDKGMTLRWLGGSWTLSVVNAAENYIDVACAPGNANHCFLAGKGVADGMTRFWDGSGSWQAEVAAGKSLTALDCPSTICYAVGVEGYAQRYDGTNWSSESESVAETIEDVTCYDDGHCWGVTKSQGNNFVVANRNGSASWQEINIPSSANKDLNGVSCSSSPLKCWAVGKNGRVVQYASGSWSYPGFSPISPQELTAIHCRQSDGDCIAVAKNGQVFYWDGSSWVAETSATPHRLNSVYLMDSAGGGGASVNISRWLEVVNGS